MFGGRSRSSEAGDTKHQLTALREPMTMVAVGRMSLEKTIPQKGGWGRQIKD